MAAASAGHANRDASATARMARRCKFLFGKIGPVTVEPYNRLRRTPQARRRLKWPLAKNDN
jgi:hypothetical protein